MAPGPLWPFVVPNKHMSRGSRCERANPHDITTPFPEGAFSHSARTAPVITVFTPVTALKTCHL